MDIVTLLLNLLLGAALGSLGGLFGIGGGLIAIPVLGVLFGLDQQMAQGTALVMVVPNVVLALWRYHQRNPVDLRHALALGLSALLTAWLASLLAVQLDARSMRLAFVGFLLVLAAFNIWRLFGQLPAGGQQLRFAWPWLVPLGAVSGLLGGLFAVGGAVLATPSLVAIFGASQVIAQGLSLALALPATSVTLLTYAAHGEVDWSVGVPLAMGGLISISWGVKLAHALPEKRLRLLFSGFLLFCAVLLAAQT